MNLQEREQLNLFLQQLMQVKASQKDADAEGLIREACARQPDAGYLLVQRAMQLEHALQSMKAQCDQLQAELDKTRSGAQGSFLSDPNAWGSRAIASAPAPAAAPLGAAVAARPQGAVSAAAAPAPSWGSGILGTVATTAAGVVAGSFLFQGISNLMGHHNPGGEGALNKDAHAVSPVADNAITDNYFDDSEKDETLALDDAGGDFGGDDVA
jgi:uncharacterized protein